MNKTIRWKVDLEDQPLIYETEEWRLESHQQEVKFRTGTIYANIKILPDELDLHTPTTSHNELSSHQEPTSVSEPNKKTRTRSKAS